MVEGDGVSYYAWLPTLLTRHSLDFGPAYRAAFAAHVTVNAEHLTTVTATGHLANFFPMGPALLAGPAYLVAPGETAFVLASLLFGLLALALAYRLGGLLVDRRAALRGTLAAALATPFVYYLVYEPSYSHTFSAFAVGLFVWAWWRGREDRSEVGWLVLGLLGGLMALVRFQDGPLLAIALLDLPRARWRVLLLIPGAVIAFMPQLLADLYLFGTWLPQRPAGQDLQPLSGHYLQVLFSTWHGWLTWSPVVVVAGAGIALLRQRAFQLAAVYAFLVELVLNGAAPDWWGGYAFGGRRFLDLTPFVVVGLAVVAARLPAAVAWAGAAVFVAWNALLVSNLTYVIRADRDPGLEGLLAGQLSEVSHLPNLFAQGAVVRGVVLGRPPGLATALLLAVLEALCLVPAALLVRRA
ncbi:MAG TPA: glycosyltransferase family 39 protein [Candidatus Dormibacteraeota bacterium]